MRRTRRMEAQGCINQDDNETTRITSPRTPTDCIRPDEDAKLKLLWETRNVKTVKSYTSLYSVRLKGGWNPTGNPLRPHPFYANERFFSLSYYIYTITWYEKKGVGCVFMRRRVWRADAGRCCICLSSTSVRLSGYTMLEIEADKEVSQVCYNKENKFTVKIGTNEISQDEIKLLHRFFIKICGSTEQRPHSKFEPVLDNYLSW